MLSINNFQEKWCVAPKWKLPTNRQDVLEGREQAKQAKIKLEGTGLKLKTYLPMDQEKQARELAKKIQGIVGIEMDVCKAML